MEEFNRRTRNEARAMIQMCQSLCVRYMSVCPSIIDRLLIINFNELLWRSIGVFLRCKAKLYHLKLNVLNPVLEYCIIPSQFSQNWKKCSSGEETTSLNIFIAVTACFSCQLQLQLYLNNSIYTLAWTSLQVAIFKLDEPVIHQLTGSKFVLWGFGGELENCYTMDHRKHGTQILRLVSRLRYKISEYFLDI